MATGWSDIISNSAMVIIDDVRLAEQLQASPALFYRRMSLYTKEALPMMSRPPELLSHLTNGMEEPSYDSYEWTSTPASTSAVTVVNTGLLNYELCSICIIHQDGSLEPYYDATYDDTTGDVTFPIQSESGINYTIDVYNDGEFPDLTETQMRLFGLAIAIVWDERFSRNWLNMQMKIKDSSFETVNESNYIEKVTDRMETNRRYFNDELRKYEQDVAYNRVVPNAIKTRVLI